jgi:hypothetical protein
MNGYLAQRLRHSLLLLLSPASVTSPKEEIAMRRFMSLRVVAFLMLLAVIGVPLQANAQTQCTAPVPFYRFVVNNAELGTLLTTNYQEGVNLNFAYYPFPNGEGKIAVPPAAGWTPVPGQGLQPLYRYHISQNGRIYYGYFNGLASGNGYTYQGIAGYTLPGYGQFGGVPLNAYYSQTKGYFYTSGYETPIGYPYYYAWANHGTPAYLPNGASYCWNPPPPQCSNPVAEQNCYDNGGIWNSSNCTCRFIPEPCRSGGDLGGDKPVKGGEDRPPLPCRQIEE